MEHRIRTPDGRTLAVQDLGDPAGKPVLVHLGTPNSRHLYPPHVTDAASRGLRLFSYDRPGYGESDPLPDRTIADCAADVAAICEALGFDRIAVWGISGGGPHALATAALLPGLVAATAALASPAPYPAEGIDWFEGMGKDNVHDFKLLMTDEAAARAKMGKDREQLVAVTGADLAASWQTLLTPTDAAVLNGHSADYVAFCLREGLAPGDQGWWDDSRAMTVSWRFDVTDIAVPTMVMHGREDLFVPFSHGEWLAARIDGVEARLLDHDGHLTLIETRVPEVHAWLAAFL
jgi:pimeloyl-ACP methyl ester carboxylesterase